MNLQEIYNLISGKLNLYSQIAQRTHNVNAEEAEKIVTGELEIFMTRLQKYLADPKNSQATLSNVQGQNIFLEVLESGLSFSPIANHVYISRLKGTGTGISYKVTADGEVYQAQRAGAIDHLSEPVLVQEGEQFSISNTPDGRHVANHTVYFSGRPKFNINNFVVGYIYIAYPNGDRELSWLSLERLKELRAKSPNQDMYNDESFVQTKLIKHALRKVRKTAFKNQRSIDDQSEDMAQFSAPQTQAQQPQSQPMTNEQAGKALAADVIVANQLRQQEAPQPAYNGYHPQPPQPTPVMQYSGAEPF